MLTNSSVVLALNRSNRLEYRFRTHEERSVDVHVDADGCSLRLVHMDDIKGHGYILSHPNIDLGLEIMADQAIVALPTGLHANRVCQNCFHIIQKKAIQREDFPSISFCGHDCLNQYHEKIDRMVEMQELVSTSAEATELSFQLECLLSLLCKASDHKTQSINLLNLLRLYAGDESNEDSFPAVWFDKLGELMKATYQSLGIVLNRCVLQKILRIIRYNSQSLIMYDLPRTQIQGLFLQFSRLNHHCNPNATIILSSATIAGDRKASGSLVSICPIQVEEEVTISYIQPLMLPVQERRALLKSAFHFHCLCSRCLREEAFSCELDANLHERKKLLDNIVQIYGSSSDVSLSKLVQDIQQLVEASTSIFASIESYHIIFYTIVDACNIAMEYLDRLIKNQASQRSNDLLKQTLLMMKLCSLTSQCWERCISKYHHQNAEYLSKGAISGLWLIQHQATSSSSLDSKLMVSVFELGCDQSNDAVLIWRLLAPKSKQLQHMEALRQSYEKMK
jgi:hypothetical protein